MSHAAAPITQAAGADGRGTGVRRPLAADDLGALSGSHALAAVRKDSVWPPPDWRSVVASGVEPRAAALVKLVRDRIPSGPPYGIRQYGRHHASPEVRPDDLARRDYVRMLSAVRDRMMACRTVGDVRSARGLVLADAGWSEGAGVEVKHLVTSVWRERTDTLVVDYRDMSKAEAMVREGWPDGAVPVWRRGHTVLGDGEGGHMLACGARIVADGFVSEADAWEWLRSRAQATRSAPRADPIPARPVLKRPPVREGLPDRRAGSEVSELRLTETFGLRSVEFGSWVPVPERRAFLNGAYDALHDLADALDIEPRSIGLSGSLAIAIGARSQGSSGGDYDPEGRVANLPRSGAPGELARCWALAFDHWSGHPGDRGSEAPPIFASGFAPARGHDPVPHLDGLGHGEAAAWTAVHAAIWRADPGAMEEAAALRADIARRKLEVAGALRQREEWLARSGDAASSPDGRAYLDGVDRWVRARRERVLPDLLAKLTGAVARDDEQGASLYAAEARRLCGRDGDFWTRPREMMARAFEAHVQDRLAEMGGRNEFLVHGAEAGRFAGGWRGNPYPTGAERERVGRALAALVSTAAPRLRPALDHRNAGSLPAR